MYKTFPKINELVCDVQDFHDEVLGLVDHDVDMFTMISIQRLNGTFSPMTVQSLREFALSLTQEFRLKNLNPALLEQKVFYLGAFDQGTSKLIISDNEFSANFIGTFAGIIKLTADKQLDLLS